MGAWEDYQVIKWNKGSELRIDFRGEENYFCFSYVVFEMSPGHQTEYSGRHRHTSEILWVLFQTTAIKRISQYNESQKFFGFQVNIKVMFTLYAVY